MSSAVLGVHPTAIEELKNAYNLEFLSLPDDHSEADLHGALLRNLGRFITELGRDFCFMRCLHGTAHGCRVETIASIAKSGLTV